MLEMRRSVGLLSLLVLVACAKSSPNATDSAAVNAPAADPAADKAAVAKAHDVLEGAYRSSDCNAMVSVVTSDAVFEPPNTPSAQGPDAIKAWCTPLFASMKTKALTVSNKDTEVSGDIAVDRGDYDWTLTPVSGGADVHSVGRYITIWHRQGDGSWKTTRLIWNSSQPEPRR